MIEHGEYFWKQPRKGSLSGKNNTEPVLTLGDTNRKGHVSFWGERGQSASQLTGGIEFLY